MSDKNNSIDEEKLQDVNGGSPYSLDDYLKAGVAAVGIGPGVGPRSPFEFQDQEISAGTANKLAYFADKNKRPAKSIQEAEEFFNRVFRAGF